MAGCQAKRVDRWLALALSAIATTFILAIPTLRAYSAAFLGTGGNVELEFVVIFTCHILLGMLCILWVGARNHDNPTDCVLASLGSSGTVMVMFPHVLSAVAALSTRS
jgi:hypothetical protein